MLFFIGFATGTLAGTTCIYFLLLRDLHRRGRAAVERKINPDVPRVKTRLTNRKRTLEI